MKRPRLLKWRLPPTHMIRVNDDSMAPYCHQGDWHGVRAGNRPVVDRQWIFTNRKDGSTLTGRVVACGPDGWKVEQWNPKRYRHLSRSRWQATWRIRSTHFCRGADEEFHRSRAIGDLDRAEKVLLAKYGKGPMPAPLPASITVPTIYALSEKVPW